MSTMTKQIIAFIQSTSDDQLFGDNLLTDKYSVTQLLIALVDLAQRESSDA